MKPTDFYTYAQTKASLSRETVKAIVITHFTQATVDNLLFSLSFSTHIGIDCETRGFESFIGGLHGIGLSTGDSNYYLVVNDDTLPFIYELLCELNPIKTWVLHNAKFDMKWLELCLGIKLCTVEDTYLMSYVLNPTAKHKIGALAGEYLNRYPMDFGVLVMKHSTEALTSKSGYYYRNIAVECAECKGLKTVRGKAKVAGTKGYTIIEDCDTYLWVEKGEKDTGKELLLSHELFKPKKCPKCKGEGVIPSEEVVHPIDYLPLQEVGDYCAEDCFEALKLYFIFDTLLKANELLPIYELERNVMPVLKAMEVRGVAIDRVKLKEVQKELESDINFWGSEYALYDSIGNPASPVQAQRALASVGFRIEKTDKATLQKIQYEHPLPDIILEHRKATKLLQFATALDVARVHTSYGNAKTGRLTSSNPNLQNIPAKSATGNLIRQCFVPSSPDMGIIALDYSAFEYRIIAHLSGDALLKKCFLESKDFHGILTGMIYGYEWDFPNKKDIPKEAQAQRTWIKSVNYGLAYGMGANKLSRMLQVPLEVAQQLLEDHRDLVPDIWKFLHSSRESAILNGYTKTMWGRKRFYQLNSPDLKGLTDDVPYNYLEYLMKEKRVSYEDMAQLRESMNHPIQGTNADALKQAKIEVQRKVCNLYGANLLLTVHDELVLEAYLENIDAVYRKVKEIMEGVIDLGVIPVIVEGSISTSWGLAK